MIIILVAAARHSVPLGDCIKWRFAEDERGERKRGKGKK